MQRGGWRLAQLSGTVAELHSRPISESVERTVTVLGPLDRALVLGSAQRDDVVDRARAGELGLQVVRRRSGGGAVLVEAGDLVWIDVDLPRADPLWDDDVGRSFAWLGAAWMAAVGSWGIQARVHAGPLVSNDASRLVCFAGVGPGEVLVAGEGGEGKLVGISQRRTRSGARFQCAYLQAWRPEAMLASLIGGGHPGIVDAVRRAGAPHRLPEHELIDAFMAALPQEGARSGERR